MGVTASRCEAAEAAPEVVPPSNTEEVVDEQGSDGAAPPEEGGDHASADDDAGGDEGDTEEDEEPAPVVEVKSAPFDPRFPSTNQARHCYVRYNEFYRCKAQKAEEDPECQFYQQAYRSICPGEWVTRWNEERDAGTWPGKY